MDINELITFKAVVEKKGFSRAAEFLGYSQSNVTKHIKKIEDAVGFDLFERGWKAVLTKEGNLFYEEVDNFLDHWDIICTLSKEIDMEQIGEIRIGIIEPLAKQFMPKIIEWLKTYRPKMNAVFEMGNTLRMCELVRNNELDVAFCGENLYMSQELKFEKLYDDKIVLIASKRHKILKRKKITLEDVLSYPLIYGDKTCLSNQKFMKVLQKRNLISKLRTYYICSNQLLITNILDNNQIGIIPKAIIDDLQNNIEILPIHDNDLSLSYGIITKKKEYNYLNGTIQSIKEMIYHDFKK